VVLIEFDPALPSLLLRNQTASGHWLSVSVGPELGGGVGARVGVYRTGGLGDPNALLGMREIVVSAGYSAGTQAEAHFGLGELEAVDVRVELPDGAVIDLEGVAADQYLRLPAGCA
jgi:hypothetical protein